METTNYGGSEYELIRDAIIDNHRDSNSSDFAHMQIAMAGRLAYLTDNNLLLGEYAVLWTEEDASYLCGWLGDAILHDDGTTVLENDDYHADLDAEIIIRLINQETDLVDATNTYYASLTSTRTRATIFLNCIDYETVKGKIYYELIDRKLHLQMQAASQQMNMDAYWYYYDLLTNEQYHNDTIRQNYPDTYDFLCSLRDGKADISHY